MNGALTRITATRPTALGKTFSLNHDGTLRKDTAGALVEGRYNVESFDSARTLADLLASVSNDQAITASLPKGGGASGQLVTKAEKRIRPGALTRTKDDFGFAAGGGVLVLDYDPPASGEALSREALWSVVLGVAPGLADAGVLWWCSGSSYIYEGERERQGLRGQRLYIMVSDAPDIPRALDALDSRLWLAGYGRIEVSSSGQRLVRGLFDRTMSEPARLDYCGGALCRDGLEQRRGAPVALGTGGFINPREAIPPLSVFERQRVETLKAEALETAAPAAKAQRERWESARIGAETRRLVGRGVPDAEAKDRAARTIKAAAAGQLLGDFALTLDNGQCITVGEALDDRERFHGRLCRDPLEPEYLGGKVCAKLFLFGAAPTLTSRAHGGANYKLRRQPAAIEIGRGRQAELADIIIERLKGEGDIFSRSGALVQVQDDGTLRKLTKHGLRYLVGTRFALCARNTKNELVAADLPADAADMILAVAGGAR